ncbi:unnamed protein product [Malus baccata var. baccata]
MVLSLPVQALDPIPKFLVFPMASPGYWLVFASMFAFRLCILTLVLETKFFVMADDDSYVPGVNSVSRGNVESELCDNDLSNFMLPPYNNSSSDLVCRPIWNTFVLRYSQTEDHVVNIILSAVYTTGWVGMGFSRNGMMVGSSAIVGWINKKGQVRIKQCYLQGSKVSRVIPDKGELPLTGIPASVVLHGPRIYLAFQMKFKTHLARQPIILAIGSGSPKHNHLTIHNDKTTVLFDFSSGSASVGEAPSNLQILAFFLRPNKDANNIRKYWNWYHHWLGRSAVFFAAVNIVLGIKIGGEGNDWKVGYGFLLGVILVSVIVLEVLARMRRTEKGDITPNFQMNPIQ